jgi:hypothetical protein
MSTHKKSIWRTLALVGLFGGATLYIEARLPVGELVHTLLLIGWVNLFYAGLAVWARRNSEALEQEPPALDPIGRPVIANNAPVFAVEPEHKGARPSITPCPAHQSEAI